MLFINQRSDPTEVNLSRVEQGWHGCEAEKRSFAGLGYLVLSTKTILTSSKRMFALPTARSSMECSPRSSTSSKSSYQSLSTKHVNPIIIVTPPGEPFPTLENIDRARWFSDAEIDEQLPTLRSPASKPATLPPKPPFRRQAFEEARPADMSVIIKRAVRSGALTRSVWGGSLLNRPPPTASLPEDIETSPARASCPDLREILTPPGLGQNETTMKHTPEVRRLSMAASGIAICDGQEDAVTPSWSSWSFDEDNDANFIHISLDDVPPLRR